jgi:DNA-binding CsgD family transcriptional regulator/tetratricopeptide (TPR) repeat protein
MVDVPPTDEPLTRRERQIAESYAGGKTYKAIATALGLAPATVRTHLGTIYRKLGVSTKIDLLHALASLAEDTADAPPPTAQRAPVGRRQISIVCARISDLETVLDRLDTEEAADAIQRYRSTVAAYMTEHGGEVVDAGGAEVVACFGLSHADETDAERAIRCAVHLGEAMARDIAPMRVPIEVRAAAWSGKVAVGTSVQNAARGAVHLAGRLLDASGCEPVVVCPRTRAMVGDYYAFAPLGSTDQGSVCVGFAVHAATDAPSRFDALHGSRLSPLVGRDREIGLLEALYRQAEDGEGQIAQIVGEAGIGKSRTARACCERLNIAAGGWLLFQCSPHATASPLHPVAASLRTLSGADRGVLPEQILAAAETLFADVIDPLGRDRAALRRLFLVRTGEALGRGESAEGARDAILSLLDRFLCARAVPGPLVVLFEDMHWADPMTISWVQRIASYVSTAAMLVILTARPEFRAEIGGVATTNLALGRLPRRDAAALLASQLGSGHTAEVLERIVERAEGIPLYIEEIARAYLELGEDIDGIPATLAASLSARLDRLGPTREVAQAAAVVGREFDLEVLAELVPHGPRALRNAVERLTTSRLVVARGAPGAGSFQFRHALIRDAAYESLLRARREALHLALAERLIARSERGTTVEPELIAEHLQAGGAPARATPYWTAAADAALAKGAEREASAHCRAGRAAAQALEDASARDAALCDLLLLQHGADYSQGDIAALLALAGDAEERARRLGDRERLVRALHTKSYDLSSIGRFDEAIRTAEACVCASRGLADLRARILPIMMLGRSLMACGRYSDALRTFTEVREDLGEDIARGRRFAGAMNQTLSCRVWCAFVLTELGRLDEARGHIAVCDRLLPEVPANEHEALWTALAAGRLDAVGGEAQVVAERLAPLEALCESAYPVYFGRLATSLGPALVSLGKTDHGLNLLDRAAELMDRKAFVFLRGLLQAERSHALRLAGRPEAAAVAARNAIDEAGRFGDTGSLAWARLRAAEALDAAGRRAEAIAEATAAQAIARPLGMRPILDRCTPFIG